MWLPLLVRGPTTIPYIYRLVLTTIEPMIALCGALQSLLYPTVYMSSMTRGKVSFLPEMEFLHTELGGAWLYFAFVEAVVLRVFDDERLWRFLCAAMLLSDLAWCHSVAQAVGGWAIWLNVCIWSTEDHLMFWTSAPITIMRLLVVSGIGLNGPNPSVRREQNSTTILKHDGGQESRAKENAGHETNTKV
ncbi:uncharacterized protein AKAW2_31597S [Aspergillus luchuensis]|uniref:DUF7704 domain-containing protein n=2 Tax=Aspergillus kawachii TaxID=1069201 RepID=A0A146F4Z7_ASPKA|nr:uncharacterized protein AKAW2_31597S [Aspergillus luchuensis]OJZ83623.1 hypothetical protein ASPFODRAFT_49034 [Aspergillus luchuensis CBS 106.47]GAA92102.1 hypothetical protein AKAW_10216 [Aspergillus luchuensis IFO 4308]BCR98278.1 hypothetical protein AKAW2_31597S [Aspergillus luchuensis]BCS10620.1 hypothetical protein ALUC_31437S [Aspergillus luchuensis]GAT21178.1 hypothetical protein RIB2604_01000650 [Aspergillus luchuensis]